MMYLGHPPWQPPGLASLAQQSACRSMIDRDLAFVIAPASSSALCRALAILAGSLTMLTHNSQEIPLMLQGPSPSPPCQATSVTGMVCHASLSSTVKCQEACRPSAPPTRY